MDFYSIHINRTIRINDILAHWLFTSFLLFLASILSSRQYKKPASINQIRKKFLILPEFQESGNKPKNVF